MALVTWNGGGSGDWSDPANWAPAFVPDADSIASIAQAAVSVTAAATAMEVDLDAASSLTVGPDASFAIQTVTGGTLLNQGTIVAANGGTDDTISTSAFTNDGTVAIGNGDTLTLNGSNQTQAYSDNGVITIDSGATLDIDADVTFAEPLVPSGPGLVYLDTAGTIDGGTLVTGAGPLFLGGGTLSGVTVAGTLVLDQASEAVSLANGTSLTGPDGGGPGAAIVTGPDATLSLANGTTLDAAAIVLGSSLSSDPTNLLVASGTVTFGPNFTLASGGGGYANVAGGVIDNEGTILADTPGFLQIDPAGFTNSGSIAVSNGDYLFIYGGNQTQPFQLNGVITVGTTSYLSLDADITFASPFTPTGAGTFYLDAPGTIDSSTEVANGGSLYFRGGTLSGVTYDGVLDLSQDSESVYLTNGTALDSIDGSAPGTAEVTGAGTRLYIPDGGTLDNATIVLGSTLANNPANIWNDAGSFTLGAGLRIVSGGGFAEVRGFNLDTQATILADSAGGTFAVNVQTFTNGGTIVVSNGDSLAVYGGDVQVDNGAIAVDGGTLFSGGTLAVGDDGDGILSVAGAGEAAIDGDIDVATQSADRGTITVAAGTLAATGGLIAGAGTASVTIGPAGALSLGGGLVGGPQGILMQGGSLGAAFDDGLAITAEATASVDFASYIDGAATISVAAGAALTLGAPLVSGGVTLAIGAPGDTRAGTLVLNSGSVANDSTVRFNSSSGTLVIGTAGPGLLSPQLAINAFEAELAGFTAGDEVVVDTASAASFSLAGSTVQVTSGGTVLGALAFDTAAAASAAVLTPDALVDNVLCFLAGTMIRTASGETPVERLSVGDTVVTARGKDRRIAWIGIGRVQATRGRRTAATPVIVRRNALGGGIPYADLRVTKGHCLFIDGALIPVEFLVNHRSILWDDQAQTVALYHVELDRHDILLANGAPAESYRDDGNRWLFQNANSGWDQPAKPPCAPVLTGGPVVDAAWRRLLDRCGSRPGVPLTADPDLHLLADGTRIDPCARDGDLYKFDLPFVPAEARIVSRATAPQELGSARDPRCLGVALHRILLFQGRRVRTIEAHDPSLFTGFHDFEAHAHIRWTDGDALIPPVLFAGLRGGVRIGICLRGATQYWDEGRQLRAA